MYTLLKHPFMQGNECLTCELLIVWLKCQVSHASAPSWSSSQTKCLLGIQGGLNKLYSVFDPMIVQESMKPLAGKQNCLIVPGFS